MMNILVIVEWRNNLKETMWSAINTDIIDIILLTGVWFNPHKLIIIYNVCWMK